MDRIGDDRSARGDGPPGRPTATTFASEQIARIAHEAPGRLAIDGGARPWSFADVDARANQFGRALLVKCVPAGATIGWHAPTTGALVEVALGAARVDVEVTIIDPDLDDEAFRLACTGVAGLVITPATAARASAIAAECDGLDFFFVLDEPGDDPVPLAGAAPYEPSLAAYSAAPPEPEGPRLRPPRPAGGPRLSLTEPPDELILDAATTRRPDWLVDVLGILSLGGRIVVPGAGWHA
jgi:hypothetical protein